MNEDYQLYHNDHVVDVGNIQKAQEFRFVVRGTT